MEGKVVIPLNVYRMDRLGIRRVGLSAEVKVNNLSGSVEVDSCYQLFYKNSFSSYFLKLLLRSPYCSISLPLLQTKHNGQRRADRA